MSVSICLNMIVKNEIEVLPRLFFTLRDFIDYYVIVDTGSTDGTQEFIKSEMENYGINGEIYEEKWVNFGVNRQQALDKAIGKADYALIIDADEEIRCFNKSKVKNLTYDCYYIKQYFGSLEYYVRKLIYIRDNSCGWNWHY